MLSEIQQNVYMATQYILVATSSITQLRGVSISSCVSNRYQQLVYHYHLVSSYQQVRLGIIIMSIGMKSIGKVVRTYSLSFISNYQQVRLPLSFSINLSTACLSLSLSIKLSTGCLPLSFISSYQQLRLSLSFISSYQQVSLPLSFSIKLSTG